MYKVEILTVKLEHTLPLNTPLHMCTDKANGKSYIAIVQLVNTPYFYRGGHICIQVCTIQCVCINDYKL